MKQEISVSEKYIKLSNTQLIIGTHSGIFHSDDVVAVALFCINNLNSNVHVVRSRKLEELAKCDIIVDIGAGKYDHHQIGGNGVRTNNVPYASSGLYWKHNGKELIQKLIKFQYNTEVSIECMNSIFDNIDKNIIQNVDKTDNGISTNSMFDYIPSFLPNWKEVNLSTTYEDCFKNVVKVTIPILKQLILSEIDKTICFEYILNIYKQNTSCKILQIPAQSFLWLEPIVTLNKNYGANIDFVIFPYPSGGWAAQCVPPSLEENFKQRVKFPSSWAGQTSNLSLISGINEAIFCHNGLFFARANSRESIIAMCNIALDS